MKPHHIPLRMCVVCRQTSEKKALIRVVRRPDSEGGLVTADPTHRANGRGAYVCASFECLEKAVQQKRFERSLKVTTLPLNFLESLKALCAPLQESEVSIRGMKAPSGAATL